MVGIMTATDIIHQIEGLPPNERAKVIDYVQQLAGDRQVKYADQKDFEEAAEYVFTKHAKLFQKLAE